MSSTGMSSALFKDSTSFQLITPEVCLRCKVLTGSEIHKQLVKYTKLPQMAEMSYFPYFSSILPSVLDNPWMTFILCFCTTTRTV